MGFDKFLFVLLAILPVITRTAAEYAPLLKQLSPKSSLQSTNFLANTITFVYRIELPQECENVDNSGSSFYVCLQLDGVVIQCAEVKDKDEPSFELASLVPGAHTAVGVVINSLDSHTPLASTIPYEITVVTPDTCKHRAITPLVFDAFIFSNELDLLELRLNELNDVVDYFVIVESDYTFRNKEKMLVWDQSKGEPRFERFHHKIIHYIHKSSQSDIAWENEYSQRDAMYDAVVQSERSNGDDILIIADLDEIPRSSAVKSIAKCEDAHLPITLETNFHYYNFNWVKPQSWRAPQAYRVREAASVRPSELRRALGYRGGEREDDNFDEGLDLTFPAITKLENAGWHASYFFDDHGEIAAKISSFSHSEFDKDEIKSNIAERVKSGKDLFGRVEEDLIFVEEPDLPVFLNEWQWNKAANRLRERFVISDRVASDVARNANEWEASFNRIGSEAIGGFRRGCSIGLSSPPAFFIGIISAIGNAERRQVIRDTWLSHPELELYKAKEMVEYAFFLGLEDDGLVGEDAQREADEHGDIVFINKRDTYHNMPYKAVGIMRFGVRECGSSYIMRSNDDVYLRFGVVLEVRSTTRSF